MPQTPKQAPAWKMVNEMIIDTLTHTDRHYTDIDADADSDQIIDLGIITEIQAQIRLRNLARVHAHAPA